MKKPTNYYFGQKLKALRAQEEDAWAEESHRITRGDPLLETAFADTERLA